LKKIPETPRVQNRLFISALFFLSSIVIPLASYSQENLKLVVRAENGPVFFYLKGEKKDSTVSKNQNLFYLVCKVSQKKNLVFYIENARLKATNNDSLVQLEYLPGLKYEAWFVKAHDSTNVESENMVFTSFLNGTSLLSKDQIKVQIYFKKENEVLLENIYYYRD
jgi:hypothetical protein